MSETGYCFISTVGCVGEQCPVYHEATGQCKAVMAVNRFLGDIDGPTKKASPPVARAMQPELAGTAGVVQRVLDMRPNLTEDAVKRLIDEERAKAAGLLTEEAAAHLVASNLGLDRQLPDISEIEWMVKGNKDARDTDPFAYGFVFKYQTDEVRPEAQELYDYLTQYGELNDGGFKYTLSGKEKNLFARNKAKD